MKLILKWILLSATVYVSSYVIDGISVYPWYTALIVGACLIFIFLIIKPIVNLLTLPINIITLGLFSLIINAFLFWFLSTLVKGFSVTNFVSAFLGALLVSVVNSILARVLKTE